jgi:predicted PurR-regulated permease PerM
VLLHAVADVLARWTPVPARWSLLAAGLPLLAALLGIGVLFGAQMRAQVAAVAEKLPPAINAFSQQLGLGDVYEQLPACLASAREAISCRGPPRSGGRARRARGRAARDHRRRLYRHGSAIYRRGLIKLFPPSQHERIEGALTAAGYSLKMWLLGQLVAMALIFVMVTSALWFIGVPSPIALGLIAGLAEFVPLVGAFVAPCRRCCSPFRSTPKPCCGPSSPS